MYTAVTTTTGGGVGIFHQSWAIFKLKLFPDVEVTWAVPIYFLRTGLLLHNCNIICIISLQTSLELQVIFNIS